ncbi:hypothetical protein BC830DRAFT_1139784 [Chytriomyces sp. MP71]|nr:hypothetical protein BC830DRAFT_1139784 [Chytriomyces sp. MP71]
MLLARRGATSASVPSTLSKFSAEVSGLGFQSLEWQRSATSSLRFHGMRARSLTSRPQAPPDSPEKTREELLAHTRSIPVAPGSEDCCMSACAVCVWDQYAEDVEKYNRAALELGIPLVQPGAIHPSVQAFRDMEQDLLNRIKTKVPVKTDVKGA